MHSVSVVVINYNGRRTVLKTIGSILNMEDVNVDVQVVDDCSSDGSLELINKVYPDVPVYTQPYNTGRLNFLRNKALKIAKRDRVLITDNDILFDAQCLFELNSVMDTDSSISICTPRLMYWSEPDRLYASGSKVHYLGISSASGRDEIYQDSNNTPVVNCGGGILLLDRTKVLKFNGFDENYMMGWGDDGELYHRLMLAGLKCFYVPSAVAYHENKEFGKERNYRALGQIYNRWRFILTQYCMHSLVLVAPALVLFEIIQACFMVFKRMPALYLKGIWLVVRDLGQILRRRQEIQETRVISDGDVLSSGCIYVSPSLIKKKSMLKFTLKYVSCFFDHYWKLIIPIIRKRQS